jgi:hypothetical protein
MSHQTVHLFLRHDEHVHRVADDPMRVRLPLAQRVEPGSLIRRQPNRSDSKDVEVTREASISSREGSEDDQACRLGRDVERASKFGRSTRSSGEAELSEVSIVVIAGEEVTAALPRPKSVREPSPCTDTSRPTRACSASKGPSQPSDQVQRVWSDGSAKPSSILGATSVEAIVWVERLACRGADGARMARETMDAGARPQSWANASPRRGHLRGSRREPGRARLWRADI